MSKKKDSPFIGKPGKLPAKNDPRDLSIANYIKPSILAKLPLELDWTLKKTTPWGMMENWNLSDCTCAAAGHMIECWTANAKKENIIRDKAILKAFIALSGYDPTTGKNDNPIYLSDAMNYWRKKGIGGHKIRAYATIQYKNHDLVKAAVYLFGGIYVGLNLPNTIKGQEVWELMPGRLTGDNAPGSFGGHAVTVLAYDTKYLTCISWGKKKKISWEFWDAYCDELYAIVTEDFIADNKNPIGINLAKLAADLLALTKAKKTLQKQLKKQQPIMSKKTKPKKKSAAGQSGQRGGAKVNELKPIAKKRIAAGSAGTRGGAKGNEVKPIAKKRIAAGSAGTRGGAKGNEVKPIAKKRIVAGSAGVKGGAKGNEVKPTVKKKIKAGKGGGKGGLKGVEVKPSAKKKIAASKSGKTGGKAGSQTKIISKKKPPASKSGKTGGVKAIDLKKSKSKKPAAGSGGGAVG